MSITLKTILIFLVFLAISCKTTIVNQENIIYKKLELKNNTVYKLNSFENLNDSTLVNLEEYSNDFVYDMKYATNDNFLKAKVYDCAACYLRLKTVKAIIKANEKFMKIGYRIKLYDCYRPLDIQKKMWSIVSNPIYVANPSKGSIHNRGGAVDISLVNKNGTELNMGTAFDYFGIEASHNNRNFSKEIQRNRKLLKKIMLRYNFQSFDSEWWHYNMTNAKLDPISNFKWKCD